MKINQYAIFDSTASTFLKPFGCNNDGEAVRILTTLVNDKENPSNISMYPQQFGLFYIGTYDDKLGTFENAEPHNKEIMLASQCVEEQKYTQEMWYQKMKDYFDTKNVTPIMAKNQAD